MPKELPADLGNRILAVIAASPDGAGKSEIAARLSRSASSRTVSRRLAELVAANRLVTEGKGPALRYRTAPGAIEEPGDSPKESAAETEPYVPISTEARQVRDYVRKPASGRRPVGYRRAFLEKYLPNKTWYLPLATRKHLAALGRPRQERQPAGTYAREILDRLLIDLSWASSRLEGNTYTRLDTKNLIEIGQAAEGKDQREAQMILNHKAAIEMLVDDVEEVGFNAFTFRNLHAILSENLLADPAAGGTLRTAIVEVQGTVFHPLAIPQQVEDSFEMILRNADAIADPFEQSFFIMVQIPYLQPFIDVNKRVSRLGANISLIKANLCPLSFVDVPERAYVEGTLGVYELNRIELLRDVYVWAYERSCQRLMAIRESVALPDPVRLRNREQLAAVVSDIVRSNERVTHDAVLAKARGMVGAEDLDRFVEIARQELENLHEGNIARYRLRLSEYNQWTKGRR